MGNFTSKHKWGAFMAIVLTVISQLVQAQSGSTGSTFVHTGGEMGIFGQHNFMNGSGTISAGIIGSERQPAIGVYSFVNPNGSWVGATDQAFVDGYVRTYNTGAFTFPIGDNNKYRPAAVSASASAAPTTAAYFGVDPGLATTSDLKGGTYGILPGGGPAFPTTSKAANVGVVDNVEYWDIDGTTPAKITLTWDTNTPINAMTGGNLNQLTIVGWDGTQWVNIPSAYDAIPLSLSTSASAFTGSPSSLTAGSITTSAAIVPGSYTVYTLAGAQPCNLTLTASASNTAVCVGQTISLASTVTGNAGTVTYAWSGPNGFVSNAANPTLPSATSAMSGVYTVTISDPTASTACIKTATVTVTVGSLLVSATSNSPVCSIGTLLLTGTAAGGNGSYTYNWTGPNSFVSAVQNPTLALSTTAQSGNYVLTATDSQGCSGTIATAVTVAAQPNLTVTGTPSLTVCSGVGATLNVTGDAGAPVSWTNSIGQTGTGTTINFAGIRNMSSQPQSVTFVVSATTGSCTDQEVIVLTINPEPVLQVSPGAAEYCNIEQVSITATTTPNTASIAWTRSPATPAPASGSGTGTVTVQQTLPTGNYTYQFTATGTNGCSSQSASIPVTVQQ